MQREIFHNSVSIHNSNTHSIPGAFQIDERLFLSIM